MRRILLMSVALALALPAWSDTRAFGGSASARKARDIVHKHIRAVGGKKNLKKIQGMKVEGYMMTQGLEFGIVLYLKRPNLSRIEMSLQGIDVVQAYDGETAWWVNPLAGAATAKEMPEEFKSAMLKWTDFDGPLVDYRAKHHKIDYLGLHELDTGILTHDIELRHANGETWHIYLDRDTYLEVARSYPQTFEGNTTETMTYLSDFKEVEGVLTPTVIEGMGLSGVPYTMVFEDFEVRDDIDEARFRMPGDERSERKHKPYVELGAMDELIERFNGDAGNVRSVVILSPN